MRVEVSSSPDDLTAWCYVDAYALADSSGALTVIAIRRPGEWMKVVVSA